MAKSDNYAIVSPDVIKRCLCFDKFCQIMVETVEYIFAITSILNFIIICTTSILSYVDKYDHQLMMIILAFYLVKAMSWGTCATHENHDIIREAELECSCGFAETSKIYLQLCGQYNKR